MCALSLSQEYYNYKYSINSTNSNTVINDTIR